jgi:hypothetical protein
MGAFPRRPRVDGAEGGRWIVCVVFRKSTSTVVLWTLLRGVRAWLRLSTASFTCRNIDAEIFDVERRANIDIDMPSLAQAMRW